jgi:hypothetical protein
MNITRYNALTIRLAKEFGEACADDLRAIFADIDNLTAAPAQVEREALRTARNAWAAWLRLRMARFLAKEAN